MQQLSMTPKEVERLKHALANVPTECAVDLRKEVTSEYGYSVFLRYSEPTRWVSIDLTEMDNF